MNERTDWTKIVALMPAIIITGFFAFAVIDAAYETLSCKSRSFWDDGRRLECCTKIMCAEHGH